MIPFVEIVGLLVVSIFGYAMICAIVAEFHRRKGK